MLKEKAFDVMGLITSRPNIWPNMNAENTDCQIKESDVRWRITLVEAAGTDEPT